ncbi:MAG: hypothetical protein R2879_09895 [Saprospiraceae bacterium]
MKKDHTEFSDFVKNQLRQWKTIIDELEVQVSLGKAEFKDAFEKEKKNFEEFVQKQREQMKENGEKSYENRDNLKEKLQALYDALALDLKSDEPTFKTHQVSILNAIYQIEYALKSNGIEWDFGMRLPMEGYKQKLDDFRLKFALANFENFPEIENDFNKLQFETKKMLERFDKQHEQAEKVDQFMDNMNISYQHFKKAFSELFN